MKKFGRPTDNPLDFLIKARVNKETVDQLEYCAKAKNTTKSEIVREGVKAIYTLLTCTTEKSESDECRLSFSSVCGPCEIVIPLPKILQAVVGKG